MVVIKAGSYTVEFRQPKTRCQPPLNVNRSECVRISGARGKRQQEGSYINKSLLTLGKVCVERSGGGGAIEVCVLVCGIVVAFARLSTHDELT